jgi:hypothetical protein
MHVARIVEIHTCRPGIRHYFVADNGEGTGSTAIEQAGIATLSGTIRGGDLRIVGTRAWRDDSRGRSRNNWRDYRLWSRRRWLGRREQVFNSILGMGGKCQ